MSIRRAVNNLRGLFVSEEALALAKRILATDPIGTVPRWALNRFPQLKEFLRQRLAPARPVVYSESPYPCPQVLDPGLIDLYTNRATVCSGKAARELGFASVVDREQAITTSLQWLKHQRLI
jgi:hypothetical protein